MRPKLTPRGPSAVPTEGFALVGLVVAIFIILLALSVAAPTVARSLRREREVEAVHRANAYVNAIRRYHLKTNTYPGSLEQLEKTNNIRYLRQRYSDPMTGKPDWRLIKVGENKTSVKGFFGQPLAGLNGTGIGGGSTSAGGTNGSTPNQSTNSGLGSGGMSGAGAGSNTMGLAGNGTDSSSPSSSDLSPGGSGSSPTGTTNPAGSGALGSNSASTFSGGGAPFMGVGLPMAGSAIIVVSEKTTYPEWEFLYDPRIEQLKSKVNLFGGGMSSASSSNLGSLSGSQSNQPGTTTPSTPTPPQ